MKYFHLILFLGITYSLFSQEKNSTAEKYAKTITENDLTQHLRVLASDAFEGRETGAKGQKLAANYIRDQFIHFGIPPYNEKSYFQQFPLMLQHPEGVTIKVDTSNYEFAKDFYYFRGFNDTLISVKELLFLGYGIDDENYSDYEGVDVKGKVIIVLDGEPINKKGISYVSESKEVSEWSESKRSKIGAAKKNGVAAMLVIVPEMEENLKKLDHYIHTPAMFLPKKGNSYHKYPPSFFVSEKIGNEILKHSKSNSSALRTSISKKGKTKNFVVNSNIEINVTRKSKEILTENVLGFIPGTDLKEEVVILTAHYDHIGMSHGEIYNGADDDGSGTSALIELAQAFAKAKIDGNGPRRSVLIMPVTGEEKGLLGSQYYVENPVFPLENTVADLNIDMIGRLDKAHEDNSNYIYLIGSDKLSTELHAISEMANETYTNIELDYTFNKPNDPNRFYYRSDHYNFAKHKIPVIFYFNGVHADYHKPSDTIEKIDFKKMENITRLVFYTAWEIANRDERIKVDVESDFKD